MNPLDPQGWWGFPPWPDPDDRRHRSPDELNREAVQRWLSIAVLCVCGAALVPITAMPLAFAVLMIVTGAGSGALAYRKGDHPLADHLTGWDEAAWSMTIGFGLLVWSGARVV
jgi:hypothetical protein